VVCADDGPKISTLLLVVAVVVVVVSPTDSTYGVSNGS
jgi:hypothetical protein